MVFPIHAHSLGESASEKANPSASAPAPPDVTGDNARDESRDEARLMQLARHDPALFAPVYERYFDRVYAYCLRRAGDATEAEDLCSQVFTRALGGLHQYRGGLVAAWLFQIAHNVVVNHYRGRRPLVPFDDDALSSVQAEDDFIEHTERADDGRLLNALVAALPDAHRDLLSLTLDAGLTSQEAGAATGRSAVAVRVQLHRILKGLRERYVEATGGDRP